MMCILWIPTQMDGVKPRSRYCAEPISVPNMILDYNHHMGGVDHLDQFRAYYDVGIAGRKCWKYIMFGLFNFAIVYDIPLGSFVTAASCNY